METLADDPGQDIGLVEPSLSLSSSMEGNRHDRVDGAPIKEIGDSRRHEAPQMGPQGDSSTVFEQEEDLPEGVVPVIENGGAGEKELGRPGPARLATVRGGMGEGAAPKGAPAPGTEGGVENPDPSPAGAADDRSGSNAERALTDGTPGREQELEEGKVEFRAPALEAAARLNDSTERFDVSHRPERVEGLVEGLAEGRWRRRPHTEGGRWPEKSALPTFLLLLARNAELSKGKGFQASDGDLFPALLARAVRPEADLLQSGVHLAQEPPFRITQGKQELLGVRARRLVSQVQRPSLRLEPGGIARTDPAHEPLPLFQEPFLQFLELGRPHLASVLPLGRITPEPLQIVVTPRFCVENMDDEVMVVKQNPPRLWIPFPVMHPDLRLLEALPDVIGNGTDVPVGIGTADQKMIRKARDPPEVQDDRIVRLDLPGCLRC